MPCHEEPKASGYVPVSCCRVAVCWFSESLQCNSTEGLFCYEWFDDTANLEATSLPPHEAFVS